MNKLSHIKALNAIDLIIKFIAAIYVNVIVQNAVASVPASKVHAQIRCLKLNELARVVKDEVRSAVLSLYCCRIDSASLHFLALQECSHRIIGGAIFACDATDYEDGSLVKDGK